MGSMHTPACTARRPLAVRACLGPLLHRPRPQGEAFLSRRPQLPRPACRRLQLAAQGQRPGGGGDPSERAQRKDDQRIILGTCEWHAGPEHSLSESTAKPAAGAYSRPTESLPLLAHTQAWP